MNKGRLQRLEGDLQSSAYYSWRDPRTINGNSVFFAVALPPPVHGQSVVTTSVISVAKQIARVSNFEIVDIGPGRQKGKLKYHMTRIFRVIGALAILIKRGSKPDQVLYTVFESGFGVVYNLLIVGLARKFGYRIILHHHTSRHTLFLQRRFAFLAHVAGPDCLHVVLSEAMAQNLRTVYPFVNNVLISHNACHIPDPKRTAKPPKLSSKVRVGILGNLCAEKGLNIAIEAACKCRERGLDMEFVFAGPAVGHEAVAALSRAKLLLVDFIEVCGPIFGPAKEAFFRTIDIFLFPSLYRYEAQPLVVLEAMSYGLPIIATHCGYVKELVDDEGAVLDIDGRLPDSIADQLETLVTTRSYGWRKTIDPNSRFQQLRASATEQLYDLVNALFIVRSNNRGSLAPGSLDQPKPIEKEANTEFMDVSPNYLPISSLFFRLMPKLVVQSGAASQSASMINFERTFEPRRAPLNSSERPAKRCLDLVGAVLGLISILPLLALVSLAITLDSPGPIIFRQRRVGLNGKEFVIYKFRTMRVLEDGPSIDQAQRDDPRVTRVGRILRRTSVDELPQLCNVLKGDMSLIGPRPHALAHDKTYVSLIHYYARRYDIKPGITGWAQINGLRGETKSTVEMAERVALDLWYINNRSILLDLRILFLTCFRLLGAKAY
jgi:lipopolysaccharide/colanic/teichoic acid biosynthesis glycosyltransferase/glycosyltransferase involved in cell wall biosynthesis